MIRLLMLDFDTTLIAAVRRTLRREQVEVVGASDVACALHHVHTESFAAALLDVDLLDEQELAAFGALPRVLTTSFPGTEHELRTLRLDSPGRLLRKPFSSAELLSALHDVLDIPSLGSLSLVDVLRRAHSDGRSIVLRVGDAEVIVERGELVHAECADARGERALARLLSEAPRELVVLPPRLVERTIWRPFRALMLDLLRSLDEDEQLAQDESEARAVRPGVQGGSR